ncbi:MAG: hypothetical protein ABJM06_09290 [Gilvibacter sp.]
MVRFLQFLCIVVFAGIGIGYYLKGSDPKLGDLIIGLSLVSGMFLLMPLFIYHRYKNRDVKDFMLNKENIERMRRYQYGDEEE